MGTHLTKRLSLHNKITVFDKKKISKTSSHINYIQGNIININKVFKNKKFQFIFHLAEFARVTQSFEYLDETIESNYHGFIEVLKFAKKNNSKVIYTSSSSIFADYRKVKIPPYVYLKKNNVNFLKYYASITGLNYAIVYLYNVYGQGEANEGKFSTVIGKFLEQARKHKLITIHLPGSQKRLFTHVDDTVRGLELIADKGFGDLYCLGSNDLISLNKLGKKFNCKIKYIKSPEGNRLNVVIDRSKIKEIGWESKISLNDYLREELSKINDKV